MCMYALITFVDYLFYAGAVLLTMINIAKCSLSTPIIAKYILIAVSLKHWRRSVQICKK